MNRCTVYKIERSKKQKQKATFDNHPPMLLILYIPKINALHYCPPVCLFARPNHILKPQSINVLAQIKSENSILHRIVVATRCSYNWKFDSDFVSYILFAPLLLSESCCHCFFLCLSCRWQCINFSGLISIAIYLYACMYCIYVLRCDNKKSFSAAAAVEQPNRTLSIFDNESVNFHICTHPHTNDSR